MRKPWLAGVMTLLLPGLGHAYVGELIKGLIIIIAVAPICYSLFVVLFLTVKLDVAIILSVLLTVIMYAVFITSAVKSARSKTSAYVLRRYNAWYMYLAIYLVVAFAYQPLLGTLVKTYFMQAYKIPAGSMIPTLIVGDHIIVDKTEYWKKEPQRGDIVVFKFPQDQKTDFVKRVIALPGEEVSLKEGKLIINGMVAVDAFGIYEPDRSPGRGDFSPIYAPQKGDELQLEGATIDYYRYLVANELEGSGTIVDGRLLVDGKEVLTHRVINDYMFLMGDNRDNSYDSRFWGPVSVNDIKGKTIGIYWSMNQRDGVVPSRIGKELI